MPRAKAGDIPVGVRLVVTAREVAALLRASAANNPSCDARAAAALDALGDTPVLLRTMGSGPYRQTVTFEIAYLDGTPVGTPKQRN